MDLETLRFTPGTFPVKKIGKIEKIKKNLKNISKTSKSKKKHMVPMSLDGSINPFYNTRKLWTPAGYKCMMAARVYFDTIASNGYTALVRNIRFSKFLEQSFFLKKPGSWCPSIEIESLRQWGHDEHVRAWKEVNNIYKSMRKISGIIKRFIGYWMRVRYIKNCKNTEDPITLESPKQPVYIVDLVNRQSYVFDARSLKIAMDRRLMTSDYMFSNPQYPVNPLTNEILTTGQCISVIGQIFDYRQISWSLERFRAGGCNLIKFERSFRQYLKMKAITYHFTQQVDESLETIIDYFQSQADTAEMPNGAILNITAYMKKYRDLPLTKKWSLITRQYYLASEMADIVSLTYITIKVQQLIQLSYQFV